MNRINMTLMLIGVVIIGTIWKGRPQPEFPWTKITLDNVIGKGGDKIIMADFETEW